MPRLSTKRTRKQRSGMTKKKRQRTPPGEKTETSSSSENLPLAHYKCKHVNKAVDLACVRKGLAKAVTSKCEKCESLPGGEANAADPSIELDETLWVCLKCGNVACSRNRNKHALLHFETPHSDAHSLCVNTTRWAIWCYECNEEVKSEKRKLRECVEMVRKMLDGSGKEKAKGGVVRQLKRSLSKTRNGPQREFFARGLHNFGNTCFANSVLQCLAHTPFMHILMEDFTAGIISLPGSTFVIDGNEIMLPPIQTQAPCLMKVTMHLDTALTELIVDSKQHYTPRALISEFNQRMPRYKSGDQQDAHEFLRHLIEILRDESAVNYLSIILDKVRTSEQYSTDNALAVARFYSAQATEIYLPTETLFRGVFISSLKCTECGYHSHRHETFFDLSLSISTMQANTRSRRFCFAREDKHHEQTKPAQHKSRRPIKRNVFVSPKDTTALEVNNAAGVTSQSDADVEDNAEDNVPQKTEEGSEITQSASDAKPDNDGEDETAGDENPNNINTDLEQLRIGTADAVECLPHNDKVTDFNEDKKQEVAEEDLCNTRLTSAAGEVPLTSLLFNLTSFTSPEVLTNADKVCCDECTKRLGQDKSVFTDTIKQTLIYQPPPVLVLHLKRFQLRDNQLVKANAFVEFPAKLDIAPFCTMLAREVESVEANQDKIMYSLYGVIEHKGSMQAGHYVAYVKVRKHVPKEHYRWNFIPNVDVNEAVRNIEDAGDYGKWFFVNDEFVQEVNEANVLAASAYVLFYERIS